MEKLAASTLFLAALSCWRFSHAQSISGRNDGVVIETFDLNTLLQENANPQVNLQEQTKGSVKTVEFDTANNVFPVGPVQDNGSPTQQDRAYQQNLRKYQQDLNEYRRILSQYKEISDNAVTSSSVNYVQPVQQIYS
ncbi:uncharacterized protein LOC118465789 [Anopheles albimanus]|uniref:Uncharacterized protein n=1 Tax=Anopheles albimanus TaxID=7167 RepID=A0A182FDM0_ANOAL|nr:uncharacterized protein LOC118465789 [Anopheles albimanus]